MIFAVETNESAKLKETIAKWKLFETFAKQGNAIFYIVYPPKLTEIIRQLLEENEITAGIWDTTH